MSQVAAQLGTLPYSGAPTLATGWYALQIGGGGLNSGLSIAGDGTKVIRTDSYGAYVLSGTTWTQLVTTNSMPAGTAVLNGANATGVYEIATCDGNTNVAYMIPGDGNLYKTTNLKSGNPTWATTGFSQVTVNPNSSNRQMGRFIACDPANTAGNIVIVGTPNSGAFISSNGGTSFSQISAVGSSTTGNNQLIAFDKTSSITGSGSSAATQGIYISTYGTGVYHSTNGGSTWSLLNTTGMPTTHWHMIVAPTGDLWMVDNAGQNVWKHSGTTWTEMTAFGSSCISVAVDPANTSNVTVVSTGAVYFSSNGGTSMTNLSNSANGVTSNGDQTWTHLMNVVNPFYSFSDVQYDPNQVGVIYAAEGSGTFYATPAASGTGITVTTEVTGIEQVIAESVLASPDGTVYLSAEDYPAFAKPTGTLGQNASAVSPTYLGTWGTAPLIAGANLDWIAGTATSVYGIFSNTQNNQNPGYDFSGYTTNSGSTWSLIGSSTSTTSNSVGTGSKTFTVATGLSYASAQTIEVIETGNFSNVMLGTITSYNSGSGSLVVNITSAAGSGTHTDWTTHPIPACAVGNFVSATGGLGGNIAVVDANHLVWVCPSNGANQTPWYTTNGGQTWTAATGLTGAQWVGATFNGNMHVLATDKVTSGNVYAYCPFACATSGLYFSTNSGQTWTLNLSGSLGGSTKENGGVALKCSPTVSGECFYTPGFQGGSTVPPTLVEPFWKITNANTGTASATQVSNIQSVGAFGFGPQVTGHSYSVLYIAGWLTGNGGSTYTYGIYESDDDASTWTMIGDYPDGWFQYPSDMDGDKATKGKVYTSVGNGFRYRMPYLMKNDISPANDNTPMWVNKAA